MVKNLKCWNHWKRGYIFEELRERGNMIKIFVENFKKKYQKIKKKR